jgi:N-methylhydantoinase A
VRLERTADLRFRHQVQTLPLNLPPHALGDREVADVFRHEYTRQFGLTSDDDVEVVQLRVRGIATQDQRGRSHAGEWSLAARGTKPVYFDAAMAVDAEHLELVPGPGGVSEVAGPAVVDLPHTSVTVPAGWLATVFRDGDLSLTRLEA